MKKFFYFLAILLLLTDCSSPGNPKNDKEQTDTSKILILPDSANLKDSTAKVDPASKIPANKIVTLIVKDRNKYSKTFLEKLKASAYSDHYQLMDNMLIIGQQDTIYFPTCLPLDSMVRFTGKYYDKNDDANGDLFVKRINFTTIYYKFRLTYWGKRSYRGEGYVDINENFFLASEIDEDAWLDVSYPSTEYSSEAKDCHFALRVGNLEKYQRDVFIKLKRSCEDSTRNIYLEKCPLFGENPK